jgi:hypothetical protein
MKGNPPPNKQNNYASNAIRNAVRPKINDNFNRPMSSKPTETYEAHRVKNSNQPKQTENTKSLWGRPLWFSLHYGALHFPDSPGPDMIDMMVGYIRGLPIMIPCDICKNHAYTYISKFSDYKLKSVASNRETLFEFFWEFHNSVNRQTGKPQISLEKAYDIFRNSPRNAL